MSGHSKWSQIKRQKGAADVKRSGVFTKLSNAIAVAAREGGKSPESNFRLRLAMDRARAANMPNDGIDRAIKRGAGELAGAVIESVTYEGFGPGGSALVIEALTDNKNRTASVVRATLTKFGGSLGSPNSVLWQFASKGYIELLTTDNPTATADTMAAAAIDAGADDVRPMDAGFDIITQPAQLQAVKERLEQAGWKLATAELRLVPTTPAELPDAAQHQLIALLTALDDLEDVDAVSTNANV